MYCSFILLEGSPTPEILSLPMAYPFAEPAYSNTTGQHDYFPSVHCYRPVTPKGPSGREKSAFIFGDCSNAFSRCLEYYFWNFLLGVKHCNDILIIKFSEKIMWPCVWTRIESKPLYTIFNPWLRISNKIICHVLRKPVINNLWKSTLNSYQELTIFTKMANSVV